MSDKKITMRDIAREAGVSVATVSYVLNDKDDSRISEETKCKIWQLVNLFNYRPNFSAKCISAGKTDVVTLYVGKNESTPYKAETYLLIEHLSKELAKIGYSLQVTFSDTPTRVVNCDAIVCFNTDNAFFRNLGELNFCPLIALDMTVPNGDLFYQITTDFDLVRRQADEKFGFDNWRTISLYPNSEALRDRLVKSLRAVEFIKTDFDIKRISGNLVLLGSTLAPFYKSNDGGVLIVDSRSEQKTKKLIECIDITVNRKDSISNDIRV